VLAGWRLIIARVRGLLVRRMDPEFDVEMREHLDLLTQRYVTHGMTNEDAERAARRQFGNITSLQEQRHMMRTLPTLESLWSDCRQATRMLRTNPTFALTIVLTLALGIGATGAMYSAIDAVFFRPLPFARPEELTRVRVGVPSYMAAKERAKSVADITDLYAMRDVFTHVAAYATGGMNLGIGGEPTRISGTFVTQEFFATLGRQPAIGRVFHRDEMMSGSDTVVLLSYRLWQSQLDSDPAIVGRTVKLNGVDRVVIGVMPEDFRFPSEAALWVPLPVPAPEAVFASFRNFLPSTTIARLAPGVSLQRAGERVAAIRRRYGAQGAASDPSVQLVAPIKDSFMVIARLRSWFSWPVRGWFCLSRVQTSRTCSSGALQSGRGNSGFDWPSAQHAADYSSS
jgi:putative ABC transport system permease protein